MRDRRSRRTLALTASIVCLAAPAATGQTLDGQSGAAAAGPAASVDPGSAGSVLPRVGSAVPFTTSQQPGYDAGGLNRALLDADLGTETPRPDWSVVPSIGIEQEYDSALSNGGFGSGARGGAAFVTTIEPSVAISRTTSRVELDLRYLPTLRIVEAGSGQGTGEGGTRITQDLDGHLLATVLPQTLFVDLRAFGSEQPRFGGSGPAEATTLANNAATQDYSFSASPYLLHRFGTTGTAELGYRYARTFQDSPDIAAGDAPLVPAALLNSIGNQDLATENEHLSFVTGEDFGRYNGAALITATQYDGSGVLARAHRRVASIDNGYAITRTITALARVGYEDVAYSGTTPILIKDAIWDVGVRLTPSETSSVTVRYGHHDGLNTLTASANVSPTARTRLYAQYSAGLSTPIEELQNALTDSDIDALGDPVDHGTGVPIYVANDVSGTQDGLYRLRRLSFGGQLLLDRDVFAASVNRDRRTLVSAPFAGATALGVVGSNTQTAATLSWSREISPVLSAVASFEYSVGDGLPGFAGLAGVSGNTTTVVGALSLDYQVSDTVSATASYSYTDTSEPTVLRFAGLGGGQHRILVGVRKSF